MRNLFVILAIVALLGNVFASYWVDNFNNCPQTYQSQTCPNPTLVCGYSGGITYCADPSAIVAPASTATSNTDQDAGSYNGGYLIDCYAFDSGTPYCNNNGAFWCDRNSTCYSTKFRDTTCTANVFGMSSCGSCRSGYGDCSGDDVCETIFGTTNCASGANNNVPSCGNCVCDSSYLDCDGGGAGTGNGCEIHDGSSCSGGANNHYNGCSGGAGNCVCNTGYNDCDASGPGVGNGCEIHDGDACTIGGLSGTYSGCSGSVGNCIVPTSYFITGNRANYSTVNPLLWGKNYGLGWLLNFSNSTDSIWGVSQYGCIVFPDTTTQCTAPTGGYSYAQIAGNIGNYSADSLAIYTNITDLQNSNTTTNNRITSVNGSMNNLITSNNSIWTQLGLISSNFTSFTTSNTSIWNWLSGAYTNITNLQTSNTSTNLRITQLNTSVLTIQNLSYVNISANIGNWSTDKPSYVPYTGASGAVNLGTYNITAQNYSITSLASFISANSTCIKMNFNSTVYFGIGSACG